MDSNVRLTILLVGFALIIHSCYIYFSGIMDGVDSCPSMDGTMGYLEWNCTERKDKAVLEAIIGIALIIGMRKPDEEA